MIGRVPVCPGRKRGPPNQLARVGLFFVDGGGGGVRHSRCEVFDVGREMTSCRLAFECRLRQEDSVQPLKRWLRQLMGGGPWQSDLCRLFGMSRGCGRATDLVSSGIARRLLTNSISYTQAENGADRMLHALLL